MRFEVSPSHKESEVRAGCPGRGVPSAEEQELGGEDTRRQGHVFSLNRLISPVWLRVVYACLKTPQPTCVCLLILMRSLKMQQCFFVCVSIISKAAIKALIYFVLKIRISYHLLINTGNA